MKMTGAQILLDGMIKEGVDTVFGFPGGVLLSLYDTFPQFPQIHHVLVRHEQGAAHAADGYARATGKVGACIATSGPGATNLVTGIANAYLDSVPMVAITGQVSRSFIGRDAFQEVDITGITQPITKHNYLVLDTKTLPRIVKEAFYLARTGRPGPVLIDIPKDVFGETIEYHDPGEIEVPGYKPTLGGHPAQLKKAAKLINEASRPVILGGRGILISGASDEVKKLAETSQIPVVTTLLGIGSFPESHFLSYGMVGMHGTAYANMAVDSADLLIAIGMRFDDRVTGKISSFAPNAKIVHIDIDPAEIGKNVRVDVPIVGDVKTVLGPLNKLIHPTQRVEWLEQLDKWRQEHPLLDVRDGACLAPQFVVNKIYEMSGDSIIVTGVGQHQMWAAQHFWYDKPNTFISSGGLGTMGYGLPASIGAKMGKRDKTVWCIDGDGSFQMTLHELATVMQEGIDIKIAILNNGYLGMVRQWQDLFFKKNYVATPITCPDFVRLAESYCIEARRVTKQEEVVPGIQQALQHKGPFLLEFAIEPEENVYPMVPSGATVADMLEAPKQKVKVSPGAARNTVDGIGKI